MRYIKICGLTTEKDIKAVNVIHPDFAGFIVNYPQSSRNVSIAQLTKLTAQLDRSIKAVGVFVNEKAEIIAESLNADVIDIAQLHGDEDSEYLAHLKTLTKKPLIQAFAVKTKDDLIKAEHSKADFILLDSGKGSGIALDWGGLQQVKRPFILAGGLTPSNVTQAIKQAKPLGVDASSGLETNKSKDAEKMRRYTCAAREAFTALDYITESPCHC